MEEVRGSIKPRFSISLDDADLAEVERIARKRRSTVSQVCREFIAEGIERTQRAESLAAAAV